ncbi:hypothetical protein L5I01_05540 [Gordonia sp. HY442]|uniref:hypothetical protein n=1 Tax=Gordonia zhenghanii TaxID=2911516 RepID=UPI001F2E429C|nr:hypothetical protein [Gordonia zhenghanii]MCF8602820.1 hypothetical protein [Gordonia zhenghanii]
MLAELAIVPSAPVVVPELSGPYAAEAAEVRRSVVDAAQSLGSAARRWIAVGIDGPARRFSAYGVDVPVTTAPDGEDESMPLSMLIGCWCRGQADSPVELDPLLVDAGAAPTDAHRIGVDLAERIAADSEPIGVLVIADGSTMLSPSAPGGGERESAHRLQSVIDAAVTEGTVGALAALDPQDCEADGVEGRPVFEVLAGLWGDAPADVDLRYAGAPFGVGYTVATWRRVGARS